MELNKSTIEHEDGVIKTYEVGKIKLEMIQRDDEGKVWSVRHLSNDTMIGMVKIVKEFLDDTPNAKLVSNQVHRESELKAMYKIGFKNEKQMNQISGRRSYFKIEEALDKMNERGSILLTLER